MQNTINHYPALNDIAMLQGLRVLARPALQHYVIILPSVTKSERIEAIFNYLHNHGLVYKLTDNSLQIPF